MIPERCLFARCDCTRARVAWSWDDASLVIVTVRRSLALAVAWSLAAGGTALAHGPVPDEQPSAANLLLGWTFPPPVTIGLVVAAWLWLRLVARVNAAHPDNPVPRTRTWAFMAGLAATAVALASGVERYDTTLFSIHMVQHVLLIFVAAPLMVLGAPITLLLRASSPETRRRWILPFLNSRAIRTFTHPVVDWLVFAAVMWGTHFSPIFDLSLENPWVHDLEHLVFLVSALLFWWPAIGLDPSPHRMGPPAGVLYVFLQMPQNSFLSVAILFADAPLYHHYATLGSPYGISALADQQLAGGLMWFLGDLAFLVALLGLVARWMRQEERSTAAHERRDDQARARIREREVALAARLAGGVSGAAGGPEGTTGSAPDPRSPR
jgi:cytochrome c oxidase assembly factor CtaG